ncbi:MAG TPA: MotA/TolQ/ExbB proton channel family protein [Vicinamibacterales bacterium]|nr:MotA/TolQ/ExbB proton channel family protein [Vicinamibacterales bacterium]
MHTLGSSFLALQVQDVAPLAGSGGGILKLLLDTEPLNQVVLAILIVCSIVSWAIILFKTITYGRVARQTATFLEVFRKSQKFSEVNAICPSLPQSPLVGVFQAGYAELNAQFRLTSPATSNPGTQPGRPMLKSLEAVDRALIRAATTEVNKLERRLTFLATTASVAPFIGLFGTVVGITIAFQRIGLTGSTSLAVVGPGISEALIATAAGLFAAIPAVVFYNHFVHRVKDFSAAMDDFSLEFLNIAERNFT